MLFLIFPFESWFWNIAYLIFLAIVVEEAVRYFRRTFKPFKDTIAFKHVVISGGSSGLGFAIAQLCAQAGAKVTILARSHDKLRDAKDKLDQFVSNVDNVYALSCDVTEKANVDHAFLASQQHHGRAVDVLFCCAGLSHPGLFADQSLEIHHKEMNLDYFGTLNCVHTATSQMRTAKGGKIVLTSSACGLIGMAGYAQYCPTKFALRGLADCLRNELRPEGIDVCTFYPANMDTPGFKNENMTKPQVTQEIEGAAACVTPEEAALSLFNGLSQGDYHITNDIMVELLRVGINGVSPRSRFCLEVLLLPVVAIGSAGFRVFSDMIAAKHLRKN